MNLWKMELFYLFRSWRGWTLLTAFMLASILSIVTGILIERVGDFSYAQAIEFYELYSLIGTLLFIGIFVTALSFDGNRDSSIFLRTRFSMSQILITKLLVYFLLAEVIFFLGFTISFIVGRILFDSSDTISVNWMLWGLLLRWVSSMFYVSLMLFTSSVFRGAVASVLLTLAVMIGIPIIGSMLSALELLMRGLIETPPDKWASVSYVSKILLWWPASLSDTEAFLSVTQSEIAAEKISSAFGESFDLDPHFRRKPLISTLVVSPFLALFAWRIYSRREV